MRTGKAFFLTFLSAAILLALYGTSTYNSFVRQDQEIAAQWAQVETQYQRRFDLIPNLVAATKGLMVQEQKVFGDLAEARQAYTGAQTVDQKAAAATQVESALGRLLAIVENYPTLKSDQAVLGLMDELAGTENRISVQRMRYNDRVKEYNTRLRQFPARFVASAAGFEPKDFFKLSSPEAAVAPKVEL